MGNRKLLLTVGLLAVIALLLSVVDYFKKKPAAADARIGQQLIDGKLLADVTKIEISKAGKSLSLLRDEKGGWTIDSEDHFPAAGATVVKTFDDIAKAKIIRMIAGDKGVFADMELNKGDKITLSGKDKVLCAILLGKRHKGSEGQFMAFAGEDKAYLIDLNISTDPTPVAWELKTLTNVTHESVKRIAFINKGATTALTREKAADPLKLEPVGPAEKANPGATGGVDDILTNFTYNTKQKLSSMAPQIWQNARQAVITTFDGNEYAIKIAEQKVPKPAQPEPIAPPMPGVKDKKIGKMAPRPKPKAPEFETKYYVIIDGKGPAADSALLHELAKTWSFEINEMEAKKLLKGREAFQAKP